MEKQIIKTTDWLTRGYSEEELARMKEEALKEAELQKNQIEEMARVIQDTWLPRMEGMNTVGELRIGSRDADRIATNLYNASYRKQKEGEWIVVNEYNDYRMCKEAKIACSVCGHKPKYEWYLSDINFCPNCGAKMKGGAE